MRPDTARKPGFFFAIVASLQGYWRCRRSSFNGMDDDDGVAQRQTAVDARWQISVPFVLIAARVHIYAQFKDQNEYFI